MSQHIYQDRSICTLLRRRFDWAQEDIAVGVADYTSIRWTGLLESPESAQFRLELGLLDPDDAARIFIDETVVRRPVPASVGGVDLSISLEVPCTPSLSSFTSRPDRLELVLSGPVQTWRSSRSQLASCTLAGDG